MSIAADMNLVLAGSISVVEIPAVSSTAVRDVPAVPRR